jgi:hypothetical protein
MWWIINASVRVHADPQRFFQRQRAVPVEALLE